MMIYKKRLKLLELIIFGFILIVIGSKGHAAATTNSNIMPNPSNFSGSSAGNRVKLVVSKPYTGNSLNAPTSIVKIYSTSPDMNIDIFSFDHCNGSNDKDSNHYGETTYKITTTDPKTDNDTGTLATSLRSNRPTASCTYDNNTKYNITLPTSGYAVTKKSEVIGHTAYYVYVLRADMLGTGVNGFTIVINNVNSFIGYSNDAGDNFAIQNRTLSATDTSTFNIPFAAECNTFTSSTTLFWQDDDWGGLQQNYTDFYFEVLDVTTGALAHLTSSPSNPAPSGIYRSIQTNVTRYKPDGGSGAQMRATIIDFNPDHKYDWQWHGVVDANGIQFKLPYDSINFNTTCPNPFVKGTKISNVGTDVHESLINGASAGTIYPFSDDRIEAHRTSDSALVHSALANPFNFRDCNPYLTGCRESSLAYDNHLPKGEYYFTSVGAKTADTGWTYLGYTLCDTTYSTCDATYLNTESNIRKVGTTAYKVKILSGHSYDSRFIYQFDYCLNITGIQLTAADIPTDKARDPATGNCYYIKPIIDGRKVEQNTGVIQAPYNDDNIQIKNSTGTVINSSGVADPFTMTVATADVATGTYNITRAASGADNGVWASRGFTYCDEALSCNTTPANYSYSSGSISSGSSVTLQANHRYRIFWIYEKIDLCSSTVLTPSSAEDGFPSNSTITMDFSGLDSKPVSGTDGLQLTVNGITYTYTYGYSPSSATNFTSSPTSITLPFGIYPATINLDWPNPPNLPTSCNRTITVGRHPYFRVYGGDILSGGRFGETGYNCQIRSPDPCGNIRGEYNGAIKGGAGGELGVLALLSIDNVASADLQFSPTPPATLDTRLDFGNENSLALGKGTTGYTAPDYFNALPADARAAPDSTHPQVTINGGSRFNGNKVNYFIPSGGVLTLSAASGDKIQYRTTIYVEGDVEIDNDITYNSLNIDGNNPLNNIYFSLIVHGNIYIGPKVSQLDGFYVAQPVDNVNTGDKGKIFTCQRRDGTPGISSSDYISSTTTGANAGCAHSLTINGAVVAQKVILQRSNGGLNGASANEPASSPNIGEVFQFTPEMFVGQPVLKPKGTSGYDSIKNLPPVL